MKAAVNAIMAITIIIITHNDLARIEDEKEENMKLIEIQGSQVRKIMHTDKLYYSVRFVFRVQTRIF